MRSLSRFIVVGALAWAVTAPPAFARAEGGLVDSIGSFFETFQRFRDAVGERTEEFIPRGPASLREIPVIDFAGLVTTTRQVEETFAIAPEGTVQVQNEFGEIRIETWDDPSVGLSVAILVGAQNQADAVAVANEITPLVEQTDDRISVRTHYPDPGVYGTVPAEVNYIVRVPRGVHVMTTNTFGDTIVTGVTGTLVIDSRFGHVDLADIGGTVQARAQGDYPLVATRLRRGGEFELHATRAEFSEIAGNLSVNATLGDISLLGFASQAAVTVRNSSGPIRVAVPDGLVPNLNATVQFGQFQSSLPIEQTSRQDLIHARYRSVDSGVSLDLYNAFGNIILQGPADDRAGVTTAPGDSKEVQAFVERLVPLVDIEPAAIVVEGIRGNIVVEPFVPAEEGEPAKLRVYAEKLVRLRPEQAPASALDALDISIQHEDGRFVVRSRALRDMAEVGSSYFRVDLRVQCPLGVALEVTGESGPITIQQHVGPLTIEQGDGPVRVTGVRGPISITSLRGDVDIIESSGPLTVSARNGNVFTRSVTDRQTISTTNGRTIVDAPGGEVVVRNGGDDVKIIALDGIGGNYDVQVDNGSLSVLRPDSASADYIVNAENGIVRSVVPLTGSLEGNVSKFRGIQNEGEFTVRLEARNGDVIID